MILLIDSYDSFTNNLSLLLHRQTNKDVVTIHNDTFPPEQYEQFLAEYLPKFEYVVIGPGPGHPAIEKDIGIIGWLLRKFRDNREVVPIPILGICLGFQSICLEFGNPVVRLDKVKHGQIYEVFPLNASELFLTVESFKSVRYHSLHAPELNDEIVPLAYTYEQPNNKKILMAVKHKELPFYGVQYHPESICSSNGGDLIQNFTAFATKYNNDRRNGVSEFSKNQLGDEFMGRTVNFPFLIGKFDDREEDVDISTEKFKLEDNITPIDICDHLDKEDTKFILLNSASIPGQWSVIGFPITGETEVLTHSVDEPKKLIVSKFNSTTSSTVDLNGTVWDDLASRMKTSHIPRSKINETIGPNFHSRDLPFWGGYLGLISYEEGQHIVIKNLKSLTNGSTPDMKFAFIERFMVFDHTTKDWFIISIKKNDSHWVQNLRKLCTLTAKIDLGKIPDTIEELCLNTDTVEFDFPSREKYSEQFAKCQEFLHSGDSYELCLTTLLKVKLPTYIRAWDIYKVLTLKKNPSPFSCFLEFDDCTLILSSPERFVSWKDDDNGDKLVELRPIKGTVRNTPDMSFEAATKILKTPKEMGENLMIVDLIRHDLYQFTDNVEVTQLMGVEEYKTMFQLVSVIQGKLPSTGYHGIDILQKSLPPGSMTGAPKKRSVEILSELESLQENGGSRRGIYSGVVGYWSVTDDADWSVVIRSVFRYNDDLFNTPEINTWRLGAGGAITVLSEDVGEWEEMEVKLSSALRAFK